MFAGLVVIVDKTIFNPSSAGIDFSRQIYKRQIKSILALKDQTIYTGRSPKK